MTDPLFQCLLLLAYLVRNGSERCVENGRDHLFDLGSLENYTFTDESGKDQGINSKCHILIYDWRTEVPMLRISNFGIDFISKRGFIPKRG